MKGPHADFTPKNETLPNMEEVCELRVVNIVKERWVGDDGVDRVVLDIGFTGIATRQVDLLASLERLKIIRNLECKGLRWSRKTGQVAKVYFTI